MTLTGPFSLRCLLYFRVLQKPLAFQLPQGKERGQAECTSNRIKGFHVLSNEAVDLPVVNFLTPTILDDIPN